MDPIRALLDRELFVSGVRHDLATSLTVVQGYVELDYPDARPELANAIADACSLLSLLSDPRAPRSESAWFRGARVRVEGPVEVLEWAVRELPHRSVRVEEGGRDVLVTIEGVPVGEQDPRWRLADVTRWLSEGGPGLAGARLKIAARIVGAPCNFGNPVADAGEGEVYIHLPRG
jgi:hypothetical protein